MFKRQKVVAFGLLFFILLFGVLFFPLELRSEITSPVAYWDFNEEKGQTAKDTGSFKLDGSIINASYVEGVFKSGLRFKESDSYVKIPYSKEYDTALEKDFTFTFWLKTINPGMVYLKYRRRGAQYFGILFGRSFPRHRLVENIGIRNYAPHIGCLYKVRGIRLKKGISDGLWHFMSFVYNAEKMTLKLYIDTKLIEIVKYKQKFSGVELTNEINIGGRPERGRSFNGVLDEFAVYGKALNEKDLQKLYDKFAVQALKVNSKVLSAKDEKRRIEWFDENLLRCTFLERPSVEELGGRYFLIARSYYLNEFGYTRTRHNLHQLKKMGITDIIQLHIKGCDTFFPCDDKDAINQYNEKIDGEYDSLMTLVKAAAVEKMGVWIKLQYTSHKLHKKFMAKDADGKPYLWCGQKLPDLLNLEYRAFLHRMLDIFAGKYNKYGSMKGFYIDMPYTSGSDYLATYLDLFKKYCQDQYGEEPPIEEIAENLKKKDKWLEPENKWWRRFILFKNWVNEDFIKDISSYCHKVGLQFGLQIGTSRLWTGHDPYRLSKYADWVWMYPCRKNYEPMYVLPHSLPGGTFQKVQFSKAVSYSFRGHFGNMHVFFHSGMQTPVLEGNTPRMLHERKKNIITTREWAGAEPLTKIAILYNQRNMWLRSIERNSPSARNDYMLLDKISLYEDADRIYIEAMDMYKNYNVLIATEFSTGGLSQDIIDKLKKFVADGGTIITLGGKWSISKPDLTDERDLTAEITGLKARDIFSEAPMGKVLDLFEKKVGKGRIITITSPNLFTALKTGDKDIEKEFVNLLQQYSDSAVSIINSPKNKPDKDASVITTIRKNNWVGVSLLPDNQAYPDPREPVSVRVSIDIEKLEIKGDKFRVLLLGRGLELLKELPYSSRKSFREPFMRGKDFYWSVEDLKKGVKITILPDNQSDLIVPEELPEPRRCKKYVNRWKRLEDELFSESAMLKSYEDFKKGWYSRVKERDFAYEIMVIAPYDEINIEGRNVQ